MTPSISTLNNANKLKALAYERGLQQLIDQAIAAAIQCSDDMTEAQVFVLNHEITQLCEELCLEIMERNGSKKAGNYSKTHGPDAPLCLGYSGLSSALSALHTQILPKTNVGPLKLFRSPTVRHLAQKEQNGALKIR